jgi:hypothetical protein
MAKSKKTVLTFAQCAASVGPALVAALQPATAEIVAAYNVFVANGHGNDPLIVNLKASLEALQAAFVKAPSKKSKK